MDGENFMVPNPIEQMDDLGGFPIIFGLTPSRILLHSPPFGHNSQPSAGKGR